MKRILILGIVIMGLGLFLAGQKMDKGISEIKMIKEEMVLDGGYRGEESRLTDGEDTFYYRYRFPEEVIEERFTMDDITREFYEKIVDYERDGRDEYLVELQGTGRGVVVYRGEEEVSVILVERETLSRVEEALRENDLLDEKLEEKFKLLKEILVKKL